MSNRYEQASRTNSNAEVGANKIVTNIKSKLITRYQTEVADYETLEDHLKSGQFIAAVIDIDDPKSDGIYSPMKFRKNGTNMPIIGLAEDTLTTNEWPERKAEFLNRGGDYLLKAPANPSELDASIAAAARRAHYNAASSEIRYPSGLSINLSQNKVRFNGALIPFTQKELGLILCLASASGRPVKKLSILANMYPMEQDEPQVKILDVFVCKIRRKLDDVSPGLSSVIKTAWGDGYQLTLPHA